MCVCVRHRTVQLYIFTQPSYQLDEKLYPLVKKETQCEECQDDFLSIDASFIYRFLYFFCFFVPSEVVC